MRCACSWLLAPGTTLLGGCLLLADPPAFSDADAPPDGWVDLVVRNSSMCALQAEGSLWCGAGPNELRREAEGPIVAISQGEDGSLCRVGEDGGLSCSGGIEGFTLDGPFTDVSGGADAGCGLLTAGGAQCWPENPDVAGPFSALGAGDRFACGIREGSGGLSCWSIDDVIFDEPLTDVPAGAFRQVVTSHEVGCAIRSSGSVACWGYDFGGLLAGPPSGSYVDLAVRYSLGCAISEAGAVECWGEDAAVAEGRLPAQGVAFTALDLGGFEGRCGIDTQTRLHCW